MSSSAASDVYKRQIQERIAQATQQEGRHRFPWPLRWLNAFIPN